MWATYCLILFTPPTTFPLNLHFPLSWFEENGFPSHKATKIIKKIRNYSSQPSNSKIIAAQPHKITTIIYDIYITVIEFETKFHHQQQSQIYQ